MQGAHNVKSYLTMQKKLLVSTKCGLGRGKSTTEQILILRHIIKKSK